MRRGCAGWEGCGGGRCTEGEGRRVHERGGDEGTDGGKDTAGPHETLVVRRVSEGTEIRASIGGLQVHGLIEF